MAFFNTQKIIDRYKAVQAAEQKEKEDYEKGVKQSLGLTPSETASAPVPQSNTKKYLLIGGGAILLIVAAVVIIKKIRN